VTCRPSSEMVAVVEWVIDDFPAGWMGGLAADYSPETDGGPWRQDGFVNYPSALDRWNELAAQHEAGDLNLAALILWLRDLDTSRALNTRRRWVASHVLPIGATA